MRRLELPEDLVAIAKARHAVLGSAALRKAGLDESWQRRRVKAGELRQPHRGVLVVVALIDPFTRVAAAQAACAAVFAERRAGAGIWRYDGFTQWPEDGVSLDLAAQLRARIRRRRLPRIRRAEIPDDAITTHDGLRVTTPAWTLASLEDVGATEDDLELALESALRNRLTTEETLRAIDKPVLHAALSRREPGAPPTGSYLETRFLQWIVRPAQLPDPRRQVEILCSGQGDPYQADFFWPGLDVEVDGGQHKEQQDHDARRDHRIRAEHGIAVVRFTWNQIHFQPRWVRGAMVKELKNLGYAAV